MTLFDTDILIWVQRGNQKAANLINDFDDRKISIITYMELLQCAQNKNHHQLTKEFLKHFNFATIALNENIGHRASIYIEEYSLSHGIQVADALIAATAIENNLILATSNYKHFKIISELQLKQFKPH